MITIKTYGGLGNQLFQYALGRALSETHSLPLTLDTGWYNKNFAKNVTPREFLLGDFQCNFKVASVITFVTSRVSRHIHIGKPYITEKEAFVFDETLSNASAQGAYVDGYWQNEKYFLTIRNILLKELQLNKKLLNADSYTKYSEKIMRVAQPVSLHVRRTDYIGLSSVDHICGIEYYKRTMKEISKKIINPTFFVFSDDIEWTKIHLPKEYKYEFVEANNSHPSIDMILMSLCEGHIIANSTFSWWGAWLDPKPDTIVIGPQIWNSTFPERNIMPPSWHRV